MNFRTESSSWKILSTSIESSGRRMPIEMESLCTSIQGGSTSAERDWTSAGSFLRGAPSAFGLMIPDNIGRGAGRSMMTNLVHTTPGIPEFMEPEVALVTAGVEYDVLGIGYHDISDADRAAITALHPRPDFKRQILQAFTDGIAPRPETTFGNVKADVLERYVPGFRRGDFVEVILNSAWPQ